jgi:hypothetical protein
VTDEGRPKTPAAVTTECSQIIEQHLNVEFYRESRAKFLSVCDDYALCMLVSKDHGNKYWFGIFDHQIEWFESQNIPNQYFALACGGSDLIFLFPPNIFESWKSLLSSRYLPDRDKTYWHINIKKINDIWKMQTKKEFDDISLEEFQIGDKKSQEAKLENKQGSGGVGEVNNLTKKKGSRLILCECQSCGCKIRLARSWINLAIENSESGLSCPVCQQIEMKTN